PVAENSEATRISGTPPEILYTSPDVAVDGERTLKSLTDNGTTTDATESTTLDTEDAKTSDLTQPLTSVAQTGGNNSSSSDAGFAEPSTESFHARSSRIPFYSPSPKTSPSSTGISQQPMNSTDTGKKTSASHTDSMYISTTFTRGGERTLLSITNSSSSESVTSSAEISNSYKLSSSSRTQSGGSNTSSSDGDFPALSTESLLVHSSKGPVYSSTVNEPNTTLLYTSSQLSSIDNSSSFSSSVSSPDGSILPTLIPHGFSSPEPSHPSSDLPPPSSPSAHLASSLSTSPTTLGPPSFGPTTDYPIVTKPPKVQTAATTTKTVYVTGMSTKAVEMSNATTVKMTELNVPTTHPPQTSASSKSTGGLPTTSPVTTKPTTAVPLGSTKSFLTTTSRTRGKSLKGGPQSSETTSTQLSPTFYFSGSVCARNPCLNHGKCVVAGVTGRSARCECSPGWQGETCGADVDECLSNPCPAQATCSNTQGSFLCTCSLGYQLEKGNCNLVRTFIGQVPLKLNTTGGKYSELHQVEDEIITLVRAIPQTVTDAAVRVTSFIRVSVQSTFSLTSNVTLYDVVNSVNVTVFFYLLFLAVGGLCRLKAPECDKATSECTDLEGIAVCQCKPGYFKSNKLDHTCRACEDGYKLENETCVSCPFGLGGFNCENPYQLITVVIAAAGGGLLLIMGIALIVTCCRKTKNDISKLIFKSGDFQMSPYAEYPKTPRAQEWGRETIEMQENGSTKNLLQMTDVYYPPANLRNPELERNGLYPPYTGLPGSRHSCIYPGQYNPSFTSDEARRRDYF
uniref:Heart development protein with EGF like domains 1 n=1 Tax=Sphenodon punctatus TaxID=8508 RepID=A0A8D0HG31_SPHPU